MTLWWASGNRLRPSAGFRSEISPNDTFSSEYFLKTGFPKNVYRVRHLMHRRGRVDLLKPSGGAERAIGSLAHCHRPVHRSRGPVWRSRHARHENHGCFRPHRKNHGWDNVCLDPGYRIQRAYHFRGFFTPQEAWIVKNPTRETIWAVLLCC